MQSKNFDSVVLAIVDGIGVAPPSEHNAVTRANTPNLDRFWNEYPHTYLHAAGKWAGLSDGRVPNSIIAHRNIGAGQILPTPKSQIDNALKSESFYENPELVKAFMHARKNSSNVHIFASFDASESVADVEHFIAVLEIALAQKADRDRLFVHLFGVEEKGMLEWIEQINNLCLERRMGRVMSVMGGVYAMDSHQEWDKTEVAYKALVRGEAHVVLNHQQHLAKAYRKKEIDYTLEPFFVMWNEQDKPQGVESRDSLIFLNFNGDDLKQLISALNDPLISIFPRVGQPQDLFIVGLSEMGRDLPMQVAFKTMDVENHLGKVVSDNQRRQVRVAEADKFANVTFFFNQGRAKPLPGELQLEVPLTDQSDPALNQRLVTDVVMQKLSEGYGLCVANFSGPDVFGHLGDVEKATESMEVVDECLGRMTNYLLKNNGCLIITSDHGNAEMMHDELRKLPHTGHTNHRVPFVAVGKNLVHADLAEGTLADISPTILELLGLEVPAEMTGRNLLLL